MSIHPEHTWGHSEAFGRAYYTRALQTLRELQDDTDTIVEISRQVVDTVRAGGTVYMNVTTGHMPTYELVNEREGNPALFEFTGSDCCTPEQYEAMGVGDMLLTNSVTEAVHNAREAGVYVVVFTTCYVNNRLTPPGRVHPNVNDWVPEDVATRVVNTSIPWYQGLVNIPEMPYMEAFPGSANVSCSIHWMITAECARALATGENPDGRLARQYVGIVTNRVDAFFASHTETFNKTAEVMAKRFIAGGHYYVRSRNEGVQSECHGVAQGLMMANLFETGEQSVTGDQDVLLISMVSIDDPTEYTWANEARANGTYIVGIGPGNNDRLTDLCDVYLCNQCFETAGVLDVEGHDEPICPATGIINNILVQSLSAQFVDEMCRRGQVPYFYMGGYRTGGGPFNEMMRPLALARGF